MWNKTGPNKSIEHNRIKIHCSPNVCYNCRLRINWFKVKLWQRAEHYISLKFHPKSHYLVSLLLPVWHTLYETNRPILNQSVHTFSMLSDCIILEGDSRLNHGLRGLIAGFVGVSTLLDSCGSFSGVLCLLWRVISTNTPPQDQRFLNMDCACRGLLTQRGYDGKLSVGLMVINSAAPQFFTFPPLSYYLSTIFCPLWGGGGG